MYPHRVCRSIHSRFGTLFFLIAMGVLLGNAAVWSQSPPSKDGSSGTADTLSAATSNALPQSQEPDVVGQTNGPAGPSASPAASTNRVAQQGPDAQLDFDPEQMHLRDLLRIGKGPMYVLVGLSLLGIFLVGYFVITLRSTRVVPPELLARLQEDLQQGQYQSALQHARQNRSALGALVLPSLEHYTSNRSSRPGLIRELLESEGARQTSIIQNRIQYLHDISVVAPLIGLLGTVLGMLEAFSGIALDIAQAKPIQLAQGVSRALITTAAGLSVGIPSMVAYSFFRSRSANLIADLEEASAKVLALLTEEEGSTGSTQQKGKRSSKKGGSQQRSKKQSNQGSTNAQQSGGSQSKKKTASKKKASSSSSSSSGSRSNAGSGSRADSGSSSPSEPSSTDSTSDFSTS